VHRAPQQRDAGRRAIRLAALAFFLAFAAAPVPAEVQIVVHGSTGLGLDGLKGYLGDQDRKDRIVVLTDEAPVHLLFFWDSPSLDPWVTVTDAKGAVVGEFALVKANRVVLGRPGRYVLVIEARSGAGHWFCVVLGSREWDPNR
jgi:hypothetical protein